MNDPDSLLYKLGVYLVLGLALSLAYVAFRAAARLAWTRLAALARPPDPPTDTEPSAASPRAWPTILWKKKRLRQQIWNASRASRPPEPPEPEPPDPPRRLPESPRTRPPEPPAAPMPPVPVLPWRPAPVRTGRNAQAVPEPYRVDDEESP